MRIEQFEEMDVMANILTYFQISDDPMSREAIIKSCSKFLLELSFFEIMQANFPIDVKLALLNFQNTVSDYNNSLLRKQYENV